MGSVFVMPLKLMLLAMPLLTLRTDEVIVEMQASLKFVFQITQIVF